MEEGVTLIFIPFLEAILQLFLCLLEIVFFGIALLFHLVELLIWSIRSRFNKSLPAPQRRTFEGPGWMRKRERTSWGRLAVILIICAVAGGLFAHDHFFKADLSFVSTNGNVAYNLEYELVKKNGKSESARHKTPPGSEYTTYRWHEVRITDDRYEPETILLTKKDQVIEVTPTAKQALKDKVIRASGTLATKAIGTTWDYLQRNRKDESASDAEGN